MNVWCKIINNIIKMIKLQAEKRETAPSIPRTCGYSRRSHILAFKTFNFAKLKNFLRYFIGLPCSITCQRAKHFAKVSLAVLIITASLPALSLQELWTPANIDTALWYDAADDTTITSAVNTDGWMSTVVDETTTFRMIGLSYIDTDQNLTTIDFAIFLDSFARIRIYESGNAIGFFGTYATGDVMKIENNASVITYLQNDVVIYTSTVAATSAPLYVDTSMYEVGSTWKNVTTSSGDVTWTNIVGVTVTGNNIEKETGTDQWTEGAFSVNPIGTTSVSQWNDKSGNVQHAVQATPAEQPTTSARTINNLNVLDFDGANHSMLASAFVLDATHTIYAVASADTIGRGRLLNNNNYYYFGSHVGSDEFSTFYGNGSSWIDIRANSPSSSISTPSIMGVTNDGTTATPYFNGVALDTRLGNMEGSSSAGILLGKREHVSDSQYWNGPIGEIVITSNTLSDSDRQNLEGYLAWKWGLQGSLPSGHPYALAAPTVPAIPIAEYRFDEMQYNDIANEINDSVGSFHGRATNAQPAAGKMCNALDLSATGIDDYATLNELVLDGKSDFSVSVWSKIPVAQNSTTIMSGEQTASSNSNDYNMYFLNSNFQPQLKSVSTTSIPISSIYDNQWKHLVWTREGAQSCFYIDKVLQGCAATPEGALSFQNLVLGQEQDGVGNFDANQALNGLLDELLIFDEAIGASQVTSIFDEQNAGTNFDGSARTCPVPPLLIAEYRFDEQSYDGTAGELLDSSASALNGQSFGGPLSQQAQMCRGATFDGVDDHFTMPPISTDFSAGFSAMAWVDFGNVNSFERLLDIGNGQGDDNIRIGRSGSSNDLLMRISHGAITCTSATAPNAITAGSHHYAVTVAANQELIVYKNGVAIHTDTIGCMPNNVTRSTNYIGRSWDTDDYFDSKIDELKLYEGALTPSDISIIYTNESAGNNYDGSARVCADQIEIAQCHEPGYTQVYGLAVDNADYHATVPYSVDNSASIADGSFDRIAYRMELEKPGEASQCIWVSMDAFTPTASLIGVPSAGGSNAIFQQILTDMNVFSNSPDIVDGVNIATGNIEFWPGNYSPTNTSGVPNASQSLYDTGDVFSTSMGHGSMQIHNHGANQTLFALNALSNVNKTIGIGNSIGPHPDWTFTYNASDYTVKNINVYVSSEPTAELVAEYRFDEVSYDGTLGDVIDSSTSASNGQSANGLLSQEAQMCSGAAFDGVEDHVVLPAMSTDFSAGFAVMAWVDFGVASNWERIIDFGNGPGTNNIVVGRNEVTNSLSVAIHGCNGSATTVTAPDSILEGRHHYAVTVSANKDVTFFRNGAAVHTETLACLPENETRSTNYIGRSTWTSNGYFDSEMDELKIYTGEMSPEYVGQVFDNENAGLNADGSERVCPIPLPIAQYRLDELDWTGTTTDVLDTSGNALHGTATNVQPIEGLVCNAANFDATNTITVLNDTLLEVGKDNSDYTVNFWVNLNTSNSVEYDYITRKGDSSNERTYEARITPNGTRNLHHRISTTDTVNEGHDSDGTMPIGSWTMVSMVKEGNELKTYFNGVLDKQTTLVGDSVHNSGDLFIGKPPGSNPGMDGLLDEYIVFGSALSEAQLQILYSNNLQGDNYNGDARTCPVPAVPIAEYRFDELYYEDIDGEIIDTIGTFHGRAKDAQPAQGKMCNALDLSAPGITNYAILDENSLHAKSDFSISYWAKTSNTESQATISGANATTAFSNELILFATGIETRLYISNTSLSIGTINIADNEWRHIVLTRAGSQNCLYVDSTLQGCVTLPSNSLDIQSLVLGQEQDSVGGGFDSDQAFDGLLDELLIFDEAIGATQVASIFNEQNAQTNFDGSARTCPVPPAPVAEYRFDALSWDGVTTDVLDSSGNDLHGIADNTQPVTGMMCNAADFDRSNTITVANNALLEVGNNNEDYTVNFWVNNRDTNSNFNNILHKGSVDSERTFSTWFIPGDTIITQQVSTTSSANNVSLRTNVGINLNTWTMVTLVKEGNQLKTFLNGSLNEQTTLSEPTISNSGTLHIGNDPWHDGINGLLDELLIYRTALSDFQVQALHNNNVQGKGWDGETRTCQAQVVAGRVTLNNTANTANFTQVCFERSFDDMPSVFSLPTTASNEDRLALRIRNVTRTGFEIAQVESRENAGPNTPAGNVSQTVDFLAIEQGDFDLDGGAKLRVATIDTNAYQGKVVTGDSYENIAIADMGLAQAPAIIASIQTMNNETNPFPISTPFMTTTAENITASSFDIALERSETSTGDINNTETIAYLAITPGVNGQLTRNITYESFITPNDINGNSSCSTIGLVGSYGAALPLVFANKNTRIGGDGGWLKRCLLSTTAAGFNIVEDRDLDSEGGHSGSEAAGGIALGGTFSDQTCAVQPPFVYHYQIIHDGQGLTCEAETITINACTNQSCTSLSSEPVSLDFMVNGVVVSTPSFVGSTTIQVNNTDAETVLFSVANPSITPASSTICSDGDGSSCNMVFTNAGFRFLYGAGTTIANQTAGAAFADTLQIQAVKDTNGVCTGLFNSNTDVDLSQENVNPSGVSGLSFTTGGAAITKHPSVTSTTLTFGANSIATIPAPVYNDAGNIRLHANYDVGGVSLSGSSNAFWVAPALLEVNAQVGGNALNGASAISAVTHPAGEDFALSITAFNAASPRAITQNYVPGQMQFKVTRTAPTLAGSADGTFDYAFFSSLTSSATATFEDVTLGTFMAGMYGYAGAKYSEVGLLNLDIQDSNYGDGIIVAANDINIGRFIPDYTTQTVAQQGGLFATCNANVSVNAYSGQQDESNASIGAIAYSSPPVLAITAYNKQGNITQNYFEDTNGSANDFMRLNDDGILITAPTTDQTAVGIDNTLLPIVANMNAGTLSQNDQTQLPDIVALPRGTVHYALSSSDNFLYTRSSNAKVAPFLSDIVFDVVSIIDADSVSASSIAPVSPSGVNIRFGRMLLENSFGSETVGLAQHLKLEHYTGTNFITTTDNNCVSFDSSNMTLTNINLDPSLSGVNSVTGAFVNGATQAIELASPGLGNQGAIGVSYDTYEWLKYDWDNTGSLSQNPTATATFGIFRGDDRLRNWREVFD